MTWKDKLEIGLKDDAPFRHDNLPDFQQTTPVSKKKPGDPTRSQEEPGARAEAAKQSAARKPSPRRPAVRARRKTTVRKATVKKRR